MLVQRQATLSLLLQLLQLLQEQCKWKKKSHQPPQYKSKKKKKSGVSNLAVFFPRLLKWGEPESKQTQKIRTASVQSVPSFTLHFFFLLSLAAYIRRGNEQEDQTKKKKGKVGDRPTLEMP